jgi:diguanylate cyclase (GGDEF)-like protein/PAS domain S-box-containing protein
MLNIPVQRKLQFFNELMDNSNVAILVADKDRRNIFVNQKTCEMFGYTEDELIGKPTEIFHVSPESSQKFGEHVLEAVLRGETVGLDYQWQRKDGTVFWGHIAGSVTKESEEILWTLFDVSERIEAEAIQLRNRQQAQIIDQIHEAVVMIDITGPIISCNNGAREMFGYTEEDIRGKHLSQFYHPKERENLKEGLKEVLEKGHTKKERTIIKKDGSEIEILLSSSLLYDEGGVVSRIVGYAQDITLIKKAQKSLLQADMFYALVENAFVAIYVIQNGKFIYTNKKFQTIFGYTEQEILNKPSQELVHPNDRELVVNNFKERIEDIGLGIEYYFTGVKKSGELLNAHVYGSSLLLDNDKIAIIGTLTDDTEKNLAQKQLEFLANRDALTKLFNRNSFNTQLNHAVHLAQRNHQKLALILFDIDNFKRVNDSWGHHAGDIIIQQTAERISSLLRESDTFFRIGGDEFTIIIENYQSIGDLTTLISKINSVMHKSMEIENIAFHISLSIGISLFPENANTAITLQKTADIAMYEAKNKGKNHFVFYHENNEKQRDRAILEDELFHAYDNDSFELFLQPQILSGTKQLYGAEALIRWKHPKRGIIPPDLFLTLAEEVGLLYKLDLWMLEKALILLRRYIKTDTSSFSISVNISNALFLHPEFIVAVKAFALTYKKEVSHIQLELTENITMNNESYSQKVIKILKSLGFKISIDDFGTGYSSLSHLKILEVDELKIDKSFIDEIANNQTDRSIVKAIIEMSKALSLKSAAEGVENIEQLTILQDLGCDIIQGYYFSKALSIDDFEAQWLYD